MALTLLKFRYAIHIPPPSLTNIPEFSICPILDFLCFVLIYFDKIKIYVAISPTFDFFFSYKNTSSTNSVPPPTKNK